MNLSNIFTSLPGLYATQAFLHSLVAGTVVEIAIISFRVGSPFVRQRLLLIAIVFPVFSYPLYQLADPSRGSVYFRMEALFDSSRWIHMEFPGPVPLGAGLLLVFLVTTIVFLAQELLPILRHTFVSRSAGPVEVREGGDPAVREAMEPLPVEKPDTHVLEDEDPVIFSSTGKKASIYLSSGLLSILSAEELQAALAHEIAHIRRSRRPFLLPVFFLRIVMFFNPVVLVEFRRSVQEDEKICDEIAVSFTKKPLELADALRKLYLGSGAPPGAEAKSEANVVDRVEGYSHRLNIESRISRLEKGPESGPGGEWAVFLLTLGVVIVINYFVV
jgi:Zn-dependent protease with chaperone function